MESEQRRSKRKRAARPYSHTKHFFTAKTLCLCLSFFVLLLFLSSGRFPIGASSFRPALTSTTLSLLSSSASHSILDPFNSRSLSLPITVQARLLFPHHLLLLVTGKVKLDSHLDCVYYKFFNTSSTEDDGNNVPAHVQTQPVLFTDEYDQFRSIVRCPLPPMNYSAATVELCERGKADVSNWSAWTNQTAQSWDRVAYEAVLDGDTVVVFVKGLNLKPHKVSDPSQYSCHFGMENRDREEGAAIKTKAVSAAQEVVRCSLPKSIITNPEKAQGIRITVGFDGGNARVPVHVILPSVARVHSYSFESQKQKQKQKKSDLCGCTMVRNQASALKEWIMYHAWLGMQRWFVYDNNSDDGIEKLIQELNLQGYNISRQTWPWIKTQEAGFSHCSLRAKTECKWVGFFDIDEFFYLPNAFHENSLLTLIANISVSKKIAEIRTTCHSFGPSGLSSPPSKGVTVGYTCRLESPERHKSIVRPDMLDSSLLNVVHHFQLKQGYEYLNMPESKAVINHYKYQVWDSFKVKFFRRVATYVSDWQEDQNKGSKDRAPGLGTEAIEPPNWRLQFCEIWDIGLKDFVLSYFADPTTGLLPWERSLHSKIQ